MKALIFGVTGQDGSLLSKSLLKQGANVTGITRSYNPNLSIHKRLNIENSIKIITADLLDYKQVLEIIKEEEPDEIYNLSAQSSVGLSFKQPIVTFESIISASINILEVARFLGFKGKIYFAGSSEMFGDQLSPANLMSDRNPKSPYAIAKDAAYSTVKLYRESYKINCVSGILFNHESPYRAETFVTKKIINSAIKSQKDKTYKVKLGDLSITRDWGWAEEYVEAIQILTRSKKLNDHVICTGNSKTLEYFVWKSFSLLDLNWREHVIYDKSFRRPSEIKKIVGDPDPFYKESKWKPKYNVDKVIEFLLDAELKHS